MQKIIHILGFSKGGSISRFFKFEEKKTSFKIEIVAGLTTFMTGLCFSGSTIGYDWVWKRYKFS